ncbi:MAG: acyl-ACP--UDP-N-acetylglucosamine O-acyltransferase [Pseudomonadales bacterium]|nr:acyl-ACP--UDP-N-acetylglucosamine O-acyltransferase [Pseudomonadales bacterium]
MAIHEQAIVDPSAQIADDVVIGPWTYIGPDVVIDEGSWISSHVVIKGPTQIGKRNKIFQFSSVGEDCQDKKYSGEPTRLVIGDDNIIRESCTIHRGTVQDAGITSIGSRNLLMAYTHVAHDCVVGNDVILANNATLAGHVHVDDWAILGGGTMVHQFCKIGAHSMCAGGSIVLRDVPAYVMAGGQSASAHGLNSEGLKRRGYTPETILSLKRAYKVIYRQGLTLAQATEILNESADTPELKLFLDSIKRSDRGIIR